MDPESHQNAETLPTLSIVEGSLSPKRAWLARKVYKEYLTSRGSVGYDINIFVFCHGLSNSGFICPGGM